MQFGALVALLPLAAALLTRSPRSDAVDSNAELSSARSCACGDELKVTVSVRGRFPRGRSLLLEDVAPPALGGAHRFALNGIVGAGHQPLALPDPRRRSRRSTTSARCGST